jgi:hypothetical protein
MGKFQMTNPKQIPNTNFKSPNHLLDIDFISDKYFEFCSLEFGCCLVLGIWCLSHLDKPMIWQSCLAIEYGVLNEILH